ncbi:hypothetical protein JDS77_25575 [Bacillus cereus group sp. N28]|uniref:hypothetical protein n=1 Tax=Bacillus TaxID=1386 RepID=UPI0002798619|nr:MULTISPECIES: hypothetical protein [Bacillus]EJR99230.1 hypothetical protein IKO_05191 [Bacillus cereus VDM034]EJS11283.1 hypothetical protein IKS_05646 [Bacillus cereus VDM062]MBG9686623.1 hypothetical protein [Bacillus mycoides]MBJ7961023.1 hypothetical protein [Bacillus cereus group sp. N28]PRD07179.1 hypothetical protein CQ058_26870 [Bacillus sp. MYb56]
MKVARTVLSGGKDGDNLKILPIATAERRVKMERIEAAEELLEEMKECFLNGTSLRVEANDFNLVSWLIEEVKRKTK